MDQVHGQTRYTSAKVKAIAEGYEGYEGFELMRLEDGNTRLVARILFWDATGQFWVETLGTDVPLSILEELIAETKENVKYK